MLAQARVAVKTAEAKKTLWRTRVKHKTDAIDVNSKTKSRAKEDVNEVLTNSLPGIRIDRLNT